ncbi:hypothetical protein H2200_005917 [Cladophialophora chaetospira]|uniref:DUF7918 domain-containing protein n=1 Tax=Cladophialophora chaetospira TaxID=386627 RepID=A0AA38XA45_9EURO|nr:hypothetical protein H2200_005917 [Cladophialophora chaetospira]
MAIIDDVEITIVCGDIVVQEYAVPTDNDDVGDDDRGCPATIVKYIEALPGAKFAINYSVKGEQGFGAADYLSLSTWIDGLKVTAPMIKAEDYDPQQGFSRRRDGVYVGRRHMRPYQWTELSTTDERPEGTLEDVKAKFAKLGTIRVEFSRKKIVSRTVRSDLTTLAETLIPEKALKGQPLELGLGLGNVVTVPNKPTVKGECIDNHPIAVFIFWYRSKSECTKATSGTADWQVEDALQILGVLPRTPEPIPLEDRDPESLTREELVELARRQRAQREADKVKIKREETEAHTRHFAATGVKREAPEHNEGHEADDDGEDLSVISPLNKRARKTETIDLTDD